MSQDDIAMKPFCVDNSRRGIATPFVAVVDVVVRRHLAVVVDVVKGRWCK